VRMCRASCTNIDYSRTNSSENRITYIDTTLMICGLKNTRVALVLGNSLGMACESTALLEGSKRRLVAGTCGSDCPLVLHSSQRYLSIIMIITQSKPITCMEFGMFFGQSSSDMAGVSK
jgi:hypothetical protein